MERWSVWENPPHLPPPTNCSGKPWTQTEESWGLPAVKTDSRACVAAAAKAPEVRSTSDVLESQRGHPNSPEK